MAFTPKTLGLFVTVTLCFLLMNASLGESSAIRLVRCACPKYVPSFPETYITDFYITEKGPHCRNDEIILVTPRNKVCLSAEGKQGQHIINCWNNRINKDENKKMSCVRRGRKPQNL